MNTNDLYLEYARVIQMCKNTELEDTPWVCVRWRKEDEQDWRYFSGGHPVFGFFKFGCIVESAVAVLEGKPVWIGDVVYGKTTGGKYTVYVREDGHISPSFEHMGITWTPTTPKRTFTLNGVELPCPKPKFKEGTDWTFDISGYLFGFDTKEECDSVYQAIIKLLTEARDKA